MNFNSRKSTAIWEERDGVEKGENPEANIDYRLMYLLNCFVDGNYVKTEGRSLIGTGVLIKIDSVSADAHQFFLFDDILVYGEIVVPNSQFVKQTVIPLEQVKIDNLSAECSMTLVHGKRTYDLKNAWTISDGTSSFIAIAASKKEKQEWMVQIWLHRWKNLHKDGYFDAKKNQPTVVPYDYVSKCMCCQKVKFGITERKHHCVHCGFVVCKRCSAKRVTFNATNLCVQRSCDTTIAPKTTPTRRISDAVVVPSPASRKSIIFNNELYELVPHYNEISDGHRQSLLTQTSIDSVLVPDQPMAYDSDANIDKFTEQVNYTPPANKDSAASLDEKLDPERQADSPVTSIKSDKLFKIPCTSLQLENKILGKGYFGYVAKATYTPSANKDSANKNEIVACKILHPGLFEMEDFIVEAKIIAQISHHRIVPLIGVAIYLNGCPILVQEFMENGDLHSFLVANRNVLTANQMLSYSTQIAEGMSYLHEHDITHRNLAARNCMLDKNFGVKICDFRLDKETNNAAFVSSNRSMPFRWLSPQALSGSNDMPRMEDVWAYGVTLWEIFSFGAVPYANLENANDVFAFLTAGDRLEKPNDCPDQVFNEIIQVCWRTLPLDRPCIQELHKLLEQNSNSKQLSDTEDAPKHMEQFSTATSTLIRIYL